MNGTRQVSIVVRTSDRPRLLRRALQSIQAQTYSDWHVVVVDDSKDTQQTAHVVAECLGTDRYTIHCTENSAGADTTLNFGVGKTTGPLVAFHDDDDTWHPDFLAEATSWLADHTNALAVASRVEIIVERDTGETFEELSREIWWGDVNEFSATHLVRINRYIPTSMVVRRHVFDELGGYRDDLPVVGDWEFNLRLALHGDVGFLPERPLAYWHHRPESAGRETNTMFREGHLHTAYDHKIRDEHLRAYAKEHGLGLVLALAGPQQRHAMHTDHQLREVTHLVRQCEDQLRQQRDRADRLEQKLNHITTQLENVTGQLDAMAGSLWESALPVRTVKRVVHKTGLRRLLSRKK